MTLIFACVLSLSKTLFLLFSTVTGCVTLHQNSVLRCLTCASGLRRAHDQGRVVSGCNRAKMAQQYFVVRTVKRRNRLAASTPLLKSSKISVRRWCDYQVSRRVVQISQVPRWLWTTAGLCLKKPKKAPTDSTQDDRKIPNLTEQLLT